LLLAATARTEDITPAHPLLGLLAGAEARDRLTELELGGLTPGETAVLARELSGEHRPGVDLDRLHRDTEGNPLFIVEAMRAGGSDTGVVSPRVQSVIATRLALLSEPAQLVLRAASAIGREFTADLLAAVTDLDEDALVNALDELWRRRIVRERDPATVGYDFSHDRIRQVAYAATGPAARQRLHARIAVALEDVHARVPGPASAQIATHHERAGSTERAVDWYRRAADAAQLLHADERALELLDRALDLLGALPQSPERDLAELQTRTATLVPLVALHGYASPRMTTALDRAQQLARTLGVQPTAPQLRAHAVDALTRAEFRTAIDYGNLLRAAGERAGDDVLIVEGAYVLGIASFWQAELDEARRHFELAVERYRPRDRTVHLIHYGQDPKAVCLGRLACTLWFLGRPAEARRAHRAALSWSDEIAHPFSRAVALTFGVALAVEMDDEDEVRRLVPELARLGDGMHTPIAAGYLGYLAVLDGDVDAGLAAVDTALRRAAAAPSAPGQHAMMQRLRLAASLAAGDRTGALAATDNLLGMGGPARLWAPLARRLRAELSAGIGGTPVERRWNGG
jgi:hypothetical protein